MPGPVPVLHVVRRWGVASETFVSDLVRTARQTRPHVVAIEAGSERADHPRVGRLGDAVRFLPEPVAQRAVTVGAVGWSFATRAAVVHGHFANTARVVRRVGQARRIPTLVSVHGRDVLVEITSRGWADLAAIDAVVVPSGYLAEQVVARGIGPERVHVLPSGIDLRAHPFRERGPTGAPVSVVFVGRFVEKKGPVLGATAVARVASAGRSVHGTFVGYGPMGGEVARALGPHGTVVDGHDRGAVLAALDGADLVLTPSLVAADGDAETLCVVNLEAQARGIPLVTTDSGGIPDHVDPSAAVVVPAGDVDALTAALTDLVDHPERWAAMGRAGRTWVEARFGLERTAGAVEDLHLRLAGEPGPR